MSKFAWVTLSTNDTYSLGALVLAHSLKRAGTAHQLVVLVTPGVSPAMRDKLKDVYNIVQEVNVMDSQDAANLALLARPELGITFTKLHCWRLVQFEKCVFLDSDTLVLQNCDELFEREELSAAPDVSWPDCFNSGVFVYKPSVETFGKITEFALKHGSFDGGDQGLLNSYFAEWAHTDIQKHLPFVYNVTAYASYCYLPAFKQFRDKIKILHFAGKMKPWLIQFNSQSRTACTPSDYAHAADLIQLWWNIFCDNVHQKLTDEMNSSSHHELYNEYEDHHDHDRHQHFLHENQQHQQHQQHQEQEYHHQHINEEVNHQVFVEDRGYQVDFSYIADFHDPWEDYYEKLEKEMYEEKRESFGGDFFRTDSQDYEAQSEHDYSIEYHSADEGRQDSHENIETISRSSFDQINREEIQSEASEFDEPSGFVSEVDNIAHCESETVAPVVFEPHRSDEESIHGEIQTDSRDYILEEAVPLEPTISNEEIRNEQIQTDIIDHHSIEAAPLEPHLSNEKSTNEEIANVIEVIEEIEVESKETLEIETESVANTDECTENEAGLAGALSQLRLGQSRTPEQEAYEQLMRRQCWESGQIDYAGKDSFDNIWKKITQTLESKPSKEDDKSGSS